MSYSDKIINTLLISREVDGRPIAVKSATKKQNAVSLLVDDVAIGENGKKNSSVSVSVSRGMFRSYL